MAKIFIAYARENVLFASQLAESLSSVGADIWIDIEDIPYGMRWHTAIQQGLKTCDVMLLVITAEAMQSGNVDAEWSYFMDQKKPIIPIVYESTEVNYRLRPLQYVDFNHQAYDVAFFQLHKRLLREGLDLEPLSEHTDDPITYPSQPKLPLRDEDRNPIIKYLGSHLVEAFFAIVVTVVGGVILAYFIQDARFAPSQLVASSTASATATSTASVTATSTASVTATSTASATATSTASATASSTASATATSIASATANEHQQRSFGLEAIDNQFSNNQDMLYRLYIDGEWLFFDTDLVSFEEYLSCVGREICSDLDESITIPQDLMLPVVGVPFEDAQMYCQFRNSDYEQFIPTSILWDQVAEIVPMFANHALGEWTATSSNIASANNDRKIIRLGTMSTLEIEDWPSDTPFNLLSFRCFLRI